MLGQALVSAQDVRAFQLAALDEIRRIAAIAQAQPLTDEEREMIRTAANRIEGYTLPAAEPACPPWWSWVLVALLGFGAGAATVAALSE